MRIDSVTFFTSGLVGIRDNQSAMARLNEQIATGQNFLAPKDDPLPPRKSWTSATGSPPVPSTRPTRPRPIWRWNTKAPCSTRWKAP